MTKNNMLVAITMIHSVITKAMLIREPWDVPGAQFYANNCAFRQGAAFTLRLYHEIVLESCIVPAHIQITDKLINPCDDEIIRLGRLHNLPPLPIQNRGCSLACRQLAH